MSGRKNKKGVSHTVLNVFCIVVSIILIAAVSVVAYEKKNEAESLAEYYAELDRQQRKEKVQEEQKQEEIEAEKEELMAQLSFYQKLKNNYDVNVLIIGDDIGWGQGASGKNNTWMNLLTEKLQETYGCQVYVKNLSMNGNTSYSGYAKVMRVDDGIDYDMAIICHGENDSEWRFSFYYESIIRALNQKFPKCSIISILPSTQKEYTLKIQGIQTLCEYYHIPVADMIAPFEANFDNLVTEGIYPNDEGQQIYADTIARIIEEKVAADTGYPTYPQQPLKEGVETLNNLRYVKKHEFNQAGNNYSIDISVSGIMGFVFSYANEMKDVEIYVDGQRIQIPTMHEDQDISKQNIFVVDDDIVIEQNIEVRFENEEQAGKFEGITFSYE